MSWKGITEKVKWYLMNLPIVSTALFVAITVCYRIRLARKFPDVALCVQPHMVMTGQVSRLIKYVVHHKNVQTLILSLVFLAIFGTVSERQMGSARYFYVMTIFAILSASMTILFSILLGFSSHYSFLMYSCPALGLMPALFGITVVLFRSLPMKKSIFLYIVIPNRAIPWLFLIISQLVVRDSSFISSLSGCIIGSIYVCGLKNFISLPPTVYGHVDKIFTKLFKYIPLIKYIPGTSPKLPMYMPEGRLPKKVMAHQQQELFAVPDDCPVPIAEDSVKKYKLDKLVKMGFNREASIVALEAASNNIDFAVSILTNQNPGQHAIVLPTKSTT